MMRLRNLIDLNALNAPFHTRFSYPGSLVSQRGIRYCYILLLVRDII